MVPCIVTDLRQFIGLELLECREIRCPLRKNSWYWHPRYWVFQLFPRGAVREVYQHSCALEKVGYLELWGLLGIDSEKTETEILNNLPQSIQLGSYRTRVQPHSILLITVPTNSPVPTTIGLASILIADFCETLRDHTCCCPTSCIGSPWPLE